MGKTFLKVLGIVFVFVLISTSVSFAVPSYTELKAFLPKFSGWEMEKPYGNTMNMGNVTNTTVMATYVKGDKELSVVIMASNNMHAVMGMTGVPPQMQGSIGGQIAFEDDKMKVYTTQVKGYLAYCSEHKDNNEAGVIIFLRNPQTSQTGCVVMLSGANMSVDEVLEKAKQIDLKSIDAAVK